MPPVTGPGDLTASCAEPHHHWGDNRRSCARDHLADAHGYGYVINVFSELSPTSTRSARPVPTSSKRGGTISLETQSALKVGTAIVLGATAVWLSMPIAVAAVVMLLAVTLMSRALSVLATDPQSRRSVRPREHAGWDGALAAVLALLALIVAVSGDTTGAFVLGAGALTLGVLRLRTRYVA